MFRTKDDLSDERFILLLEARLLNVDTLGTLAGEAHPYLQTPGEMMKWSATRAPASLQSPQFPWSGRPGPLASELWS